MLLLIASAMFAAYALRNALLDRPRTSAAQLVGAALGAFIALSAGRARTEGAGRWIVHAGLALSMVVVGVLSVLTGQRLSATPFMLSTIGPVAAYVLGVRSAIVWTALSFAAVLAAHWWDGWLGLAPEFTQGTFERLSQHAGYHVLLLLLALLARHAFDRQIEELAAREATIRRQTEDLEAARDRALAASRTKSEFLATMSHEIRTPLNGVLGMSTLLGDTELSQEQRELVAVIRASGDALLATLNEILDFTKIEADRLELERAPFDVRDAVEGAVELFAATAAARGLELAAVIADDVPARVEGDAARVQQMLANLVGNAVKFTERGEVVIEVVRGEGDLLRFSVRDTGIGVAEERVPQLFEAFTQADTSTTRRFGGTGLGLAIVRRVAELMGGRTWVESVVGRGSVFGFEVALPAGPAAEPSEESRRLGPVCALVIEGHAPTRAGLVAAIRSRGGRPTAFARAEEVAEGGTGEAQVALLDAAAMGDERLRATLRARQIPVIALARLGTAPEAEVIVFLPPRRAPLLEAIARALGQRPDEASARHERAFGPPTPGVSLRVLVADDNPVSQRVARLFLERLGHRADVVGSGAEALEALQQRRYDVLLTDLAMPDLDGLTAARRIRAELPRDAQPRIIAMTASTLPEHRDACVRAGMDDFVAKPVQVPELVEALRRASPLRTPRPFEAQLAPRRAEPLVDGARLDALESLSGGSAALAELFSDFTKNARRLVATMAEAAAHEDAEALGRAAHALRGNAGTFGATAVAAGAERLESASREERAGALEREVEALRGALEATARSVEARLGR